MQIGNQTADCFVVVPRGLGNPTKIFNSRLRFVEKVYGGVLETWVIIPRPHENVERVLPIGYTEEVEEFRQETQGTNFRALGPSR